jgi:hypothetical protein
MNQNLRVLADTPVLARALIAVGIVVLFTQFTLGLRAVRGARQHRLLPLLIAGGGLLFALLLLLAYPATSSDLYDYLFRGRMAVRYGANPFVAPPQAFSADPLFPLIGWPHAVTAYGPMWEALSRLAARLAGEYPAAQGPPAGVAPLLKLLLAYKLLGVLGFLLCGGAIWWVLGLIAPAQRLAGLYLWLWNPLAVWELAGAGHNDGWMLLPMILAVGMVAMVARRGAKPMPADPPVAQFAPQASTKKRGRMIAQALAGGSTVFAVGALVLLAIGGLIKYLPLVLGPVLLAAAARRLPSWRQRWRLAWLSALVCLALIVLAYAPFWEGIGTFHNVSDRREVFSVSWLNGLRLLLVAVGAGDEQARTAAVLMGLLLLLAGTAWATWQSWSHPRRVISHVFWLLLWMIFVCNPTTQGWYLLWPLAIAALQPWRARLIGAFNLCACAALLAYVVSSFVVPLVGQ